ncbi:unnamed protein product [Calicophoron daubneyi]|uniref:GRIP domain-containing protein n=1 Tax=Calicophoron daubneyi TaxID=300641 RepID=A0AAV2U0Z9_CALDB
MDWLGGLSNIKGQLSNLTKDLLAENTSGISDPQVELEFANAKISELLEVIEAQKNEIGSLKTKNDELQVQLESANMRLDHAKEQFTLQLAEKEGIIMKLRTEITSERGEPEGQSAVAPQVRLMVGQKGTDDLQNCMDTYAEFASEDHGSDVSGLGCTATWQELRNEVKQLRSEVSKWRQIAKQKKGKKARSDAIEVRSNTELEKEIEELKEKLMDAEELRQTEISDLRGSHTVLVNNLYSQLKEAEEEVLSVRAKMEKMASDQIRTEKCNSPILIENSASQSIQPVQDQIPTSSPEKTGKKKARGSKKKKKDDPQSPTGESPKAPAVNVYKHSSAVRQSLRIAADHETVDIPPVHSFPIDTRDQNVQAFVENHSANMQTEVLLSSKETQTKCTPAVCLEVKSSNSPVSSMSFVESASFTEADLNTLPQKILTEREALSSLDLDLLSVGVQTSIPFPVASSATSAELVPESNGGTVGGADDRSQTSDVSEVSAYSRQLDDLVHQLADEMQIYERDVDEMVSAVTSHIPLSPRSSENGYTRHSSGEVSEEGESASKSATKNDIAHQLAQLQASLKARRKRLTSIRKNASSALTVVQPVRLSPTAHVSPDINDDQNEVTETEADGWQDDDFPDFDNNETGASAESRTDDRTTVLSRGDDQTTQTGLSRSESKEEISDLKNIIQNLEDRIAQDSLAYEKRIEELKAELKPADRLKEALKIAVTHLKSPLPPPPPIPAEMNVSSESFPPPPWPPVDPESQLAIIAAAEAAAFNELKRAHIALKNTTDALVALKEENQTLHSRLISTEEQKPDETKPFSDAKGASEDASDLAYRLCLNLDVDPKELNWVPEEWEEILYDLLKARVGENSPTDSESHDEQVAQLSAEIYSLQNLLNQHGAFRAQAERDLGQLLSTITAQRNQLHELSAENDKLKKAAAEADASVQSRTDSSDKEKDTADFRRLSKLVESKDAEISSLQHRLEELDNLIRSVYLHSAPSAPGDSGVGSATEDVDDPTKRLELITVKLNNALSRAERAESMYESVLSALQQKHTESQTYHAQLQRVYCELAASVEKQQVLQLELDKLRGELPTLQNPKTEPESSKSVEQEIREDPISPTMAKYQTKQPSDSVNPESVEGKLRAEIQRLQAHLLEMEESYTNEALNAEAREVELRNKLHTTEQRLSRLEQTGVSAEDKVHCAMQERDEALRSAEASQKEIIALQASMTNLQAVLDSFQKNQESAISAETQHIRLELKHARQNEDAAREEIGRLNAQLTEKSQLDGLVQQIKLENQRYNNQLKQLKSEVDQKNSQLDALRTRLAQMAVDTDSKVDKVLMRNLLVSFFHLPPSERKNGLRIIGSLLQFSDDDYAKVGSESGAIPKLMNWVRSTVSKLPAGPPKDLTFSSTYPDKSFTELLLTFLEQESSPRTPLRLPMEYYTPEAVRPSVSHRQKASVYELPATFESPNPCPDIEIPTIPTVLPPTTSLPTSHSTPVTSTSTAPTNPLFRL